MQFSSLLFAGGLDDMTSFSSMSYLVIFLPVCLVLYALMPARAKKYFLLVASFAFYWLVSGTLIIYLILSIFSVHYFGLWLDRINAEKKAALAGCEREQKKEIKAKFQRKGRLALFLAAFAHIGTLLVLKYSPFFTFNINSLFSLIGISFRFEIPSFLQPIGISFFSLQAFSYIFDVYRGTIKADTNIWRLGLFMSFFPQIVEGPICRYDQTAEKLWNVSQIKFENLTSGLVRIAFGLMKKVVIADRLDPLIKAVFKAPESYAGGLIAFTVLMYTVQLYMDFSGAMDAVMGTAQIFRVLAALAYHARHMVQGLHILSRDNVKADEKADLFGAQKARQPLRPPARGQHCPVLRLAFKRPLARSRLELHLLRNVSLCSDPLRKSYCPGGHGFQSEASP